MARLHVVASSSKGNCYVIDTAEEALILECGVPLMEARKTSGVPITKVVGALITHEHADHARRVLDYLKAQIPVYATQGTAEAIQERHPKASGIRPLETFSMTYSIGKAFQVRALKAFHDAKEPCSFLIDHPETGRIAFFTDTHHLEYVVEDVKHLLIECNYIYGRLYENYKSRRIKAQRYKRTLATHMSLGVCKTYISHLVADRQRAGVLDSVTLIHLSSENADEEQMLEAIQKITFAPVRIADKGLNFAL